MLCTSIISHNKGVNVRLTFFLFDYLGDCCQLFCIMFHFLFFNQEKNTWVILWHSVNILFPCKVLPKNVLASIDFPCLNQLLTVNMKNIDFLIISLPYLFHSILQPHHLGRVSWIISGNAQGLFLALHSGISLCEFEA